MKDDPIFEPGDRVVSFRGEYATVVKMTRDASDPGRSAKVLVIWDEYPGEREYYSPVFHKTR